jgi:hypothetical protein
VSEWLAVFALLFGVLCVAALGAIVARVVHSIERATRAVERLAEATRAPGER